MFNVHFDKQNYGFLVKMFSAANEAFRNIQSMKK